MHPATTDVLTMANHIFVQYKEKLNKYIIDKD